MASKDLKSISKKKRSASISYIIEREAHWNSIGIFRCDLKVQGEKECVKQCEKCAGYYVEK